MDTESACRVCGGQHSTGACTEKLSNEGGEKNVEVSFDDAKNLLNGFEEDMSRNEQNMIDARLTFRNGDAVEALGVTEENYIKVEKELRAMLSEPVELSWEQRRDNALPWKIKYNSEKQKARMGIEQTIIDALRTFNGEVSLFRNKVTFFSDGKPPEHISLTDALKRLSDEEKNALVVRTHENVAKYVKEQKEDDYLKQKAWVLSSVAKKVGNKQFNDDVGTYIAPWRAEESTIAIDYVDALRDSCK